jgi:NAD(P)-dependent dehydrogenase (short-subunit alcohol dehydrogenase family)
MQQFTDKVVLITGGTSGIGRATALAFAAEGARVVVAGRREAEGAETVALIEQAGGQARFVRADVSQEEDVAALVAATVAAFGRLDYAFNNAGVLLESAPITEVSLDVLERTLAINVRGVALCLKHQIPAILKSGGGGIVNTASFLGLRPMPNSAIYNASKFAVIGLTKSAALEFAAQGVRVNAVCPGVIETPMNEGYRQEQSGRDFLNNLQPMARTGQADEIAAAVLYLCSPSARFVTGTTLSVDGGIAV